MAKKEKKQKKGKSADKKQETAEKPVPQKPRKIKLPEDTAAALFTVLLVLVGLVNLILILYIGVRMFFPGLLGRLLPFSLEPASACVETVPLSDGVGELPVTFEPPAAAKGELL